MSTRRELLLTLAALPPVQLAAAAGATTHSGRERDMELFIEAAVALSQGKAQPAQYALHRLLQLYAESPFRSQAKLLLFYAHTMDRPQLVDASGIFDNIDRYLRVVDGEIKEL